MDAGQRGLLPHTPFTHDEAPVDADENEPLIDPPTSSSEVAVQHVVPDRLEPPRGSILRLG